MVSVNLGIICKGNCGKANCPVCTRLRAMYKNRPLLEKESFFGSTPNVFIGRFGYPHVNVGILSPTQDIEQSWYSDAPRTWREEQLSIPSIVDLRARLVNARTKADVRSQNKMITLAQDTSKSLKPVDVEIALETKPRFSMQYESIATPMGAQATLKHASATENISVKRKVDKMTSATDLVSSEGLSYLHQHGFDEYFLTKLFSTGNLGVAANRKLVPTRFAITAVDDILSKKQIEQIKTFPLLDTCQVYFGNNLGNYYLVILFPSVFSFELFETYLPAGIWHDQNVAQSETDFELYDGRTAYAENCAGGYYAARIAVTEKLIEIKRQASALVLRFVTDEYFAPLGVWNCRETTKKALETKPLVFEERQLGLRYVEAFVKKKLGYVLSPLLEMSKVLEFVGKQRRLNEFS